MAILSSLWAWFLGLFTREKIGILFLLLFKSGTSAIASQIADIDLQRKALEFVRELAHRSDLSSSEKAALFNKKLKEYAAMFGKVLCASVINCLRELAVNAIKAERGN